MSPSALTLHPLALLFPDCGLGSDPNASGPCTGTLTPDHLGDSVTGVFSTGPGAIVSIGGALLVLAGVLMLLRMIRRAAGGKGGAAAPSTDGDGAAECDKCGGALPEGVDSGLCDDCLMIRCTSLREGETICLSCFSVYARDSSEGECPVCGVPRDEFESMTDDDASTGTCSVCGVQSDELIGDLFPACPDCAAASEAGALADEEDAGPDDEESFNGNERGIGGGGVRA